MRVPAIRRAGPLDAAALNAALRQLSQDMGDTHRASDADIAAAGFGPTPAFHALLAEADGIIVAVAVYSPLFSTTRGQAGAYVSDLWVAEAARGKGLGQQMLAAVRDEARAAWGGAFLRLFVYQDNPRGAAFYNRLGFISATGDIHMTLADAALDAVGDQK